MIWTEGVFKVGTDKGSGAAVSWGRTETKPTGRSECPAGCDRCQSVAPKVWYHRAQPRRRHHWGLSMQEASSHDGVCIFHREHVMQTDERGETGPFINAATALISNSSEPRVAAFSEFLSFYWSNICLSVFVWLCLLQPSFYPGSTAAHRLWWEVWAKMSQGLRGFASNTLPDQFCPPSAPELLPPQTGVEWHFFLLCCALLNFLLGK